MMALSSSLDSELRRKLKEEFDVSKANELVGAYDLARAKLEKNIFREVKGVEKDLSDHSADHIQNVMENAFDLLNENGSISCISGIETYCLAMFILFHDVGNLFGRKDHRNNVAEVFDWIRGTEPSIRPEKTLVVSAAWAHTGQGTDGTNDTLKDLGDEHLERKRVRHQDLAAVLRFADELAEGPQRTSEFMLEKGLYDEGSMIFHEYASITHVFIDRGNERIALKYEVEIDTACSDENRKEKLTSLLEFIYHRVQKLDQERRYARYYSMLLEPFKTTEVSFNFHCNGEILGINLEPLRLTDKVIPGDPIRSVAELNPRYSIELLVSELLENCPKAGSHESQKSI